MELGNPELKSFKQTYIRRCVLDMARVYVHKEILAQTEELLSRAMEYGIDLSAKGLPNQLIGYDPNGNDAQKVGLYIELPTNKDLEGIEEGLGFKRNGNKFIFDLASELKPLPTYEDDKPNRIGSRQLKLKDTGVDVKFVNLFVGIDELATAEEFTVETEKAVKFLQERMGIPQTGMMDWYTWQSILPKSSLRISGGHAGPRVRALQSALRCFGYNPPLTSRFGTETVRSVREFQVDNALRVTGRITHSEWIILFDYH
jgi:hypothetical protein